MAEHKRERLKYLTNRIQKIGDELLEINESLDDSFESKAEVEALEFRYVKLLVKVLEAMGAKTGAVDLEPYVHAMPGISVN